MNSTSNESNLAQSVSNLWAWLHTWEDASGGIHGPVVYHHRDNLKVLRPDTWTQGATILGLLNTYHASAETTFLDAASRLGRFLVKNYLDEVHVYRDSNFDQKPLGQPALEGNAIASLALLELAKVVDSSEEFRKIALDNVSEYLVRAWDPLRKSFAVTYHGRKAYIHNKSAMAILAVLASEENNPRGNFVVNYAIPSAELILSTQVKQGDYAGAFPYSDNDTNYRTMYSLVTCMGLLGLHRATGDKKYLSSVERLVEHLSRFVDNQTGLICHYHRKGYPQWITDTILFHLISRMTRTQQGIGQGVSKDDFPLSKLLTYQYPSGAFPLSLGFEDLWYKDVMKSRPEIRRWRDILPTPGMNSWNLWFLSSFLKDGSTIPSPNFSMPHTISSSQEEYDGPYEITDSKNELKMSMLPDRHLRLLIAKHEDVPIMSEMSERTNYWKTLDSLGRYPAPLRRLILGAPRLWLKLRH